MNAGVVLFRNAQLDTPDALSSTLFTYLRPAIGGRIRPMLDDLVLLEAGIGGRIGLDGSDLAAAYGPDLGFGGVDLFAGVTGFYEPGFWWLARLGYTHHVLGFSGGGGTRAAGTSGVDEAIDLRLAVGWSI